MFIPKDKNARFDLYQELVQKCDFTRARRHSGYNTLESYYIYGSNDGIQAKENKIYTHCELLMSFLYDENVHFIAELDRGAKQEEQAKLRTSSEYINDRWLDSGAGDIASQAILWSLVFNSSFMKVNRLGNGNADCYYISPSMIGFLNESATELGRQEAICHWYTAPESEVRRVLAVHPHGDELINQISFGQKRPEGGQPPQFIQNIWLTSLSPTIQGNAPGMMNAEYSYNATVTENVVQMKELWVWDNALRDGKGDYRIVTIADPYAVIFDRPNEKFYIPGEHPFVKFTPNPLPKYIYGMSEVGLLAPLQDVCEKRFAQIRVMWEKQADPPTAVNGYSGLQDEKNFALRRAGGLLSNSMPVGTVTQFKPELPPETFAEDQMMESKFHSMGGMTNILQGKGDTNVRSKGQANVLTQTASARIKRRAMRIEKSLAQVATLLLKIGKQDDKVSLVDDNGVDFTLAQLTDHLRVKVDAHSSSPIFMENRKDLAQSLLENKIIDRKTFVEMINPPMKDQILAGLPKIEKAEAEAAKRQMEIELLKHPGGPKKQLQQPQ